MNEKDMLNDYLSTLNSSLSTYANMIAQTNNQELRQTLQGMRNQDEMRQYKVYSIAKEKGYYKPAQPATQSEICTVKTELTSGQ